MQHSVREFAEVQMANKAKCFLKVYKIQYFTISGSVKFALVKVIVCLTDVLCSYCVH